MDRKAKGGNIIYFGIATVNLEELLWYFPQFRTVFSIPEIKSHPDQSDAVCSHVCSWVHLAQPLQPLCDYLLSS